MENSAKIVVMFVNQYDVDGSKGCSVNYYFVGEDGQVAYDTTPSGPIGQQSAKVALSYDMRSKFPGVPGIYEGKFNMVVGSDRKPVLKLCDVDFIGRASVGIMDVSPKTSK